LPGGGAVRTPPPAYYATGVDVEARIVAFQLRVWFPASIYNCALCLLMVKSKLFSFAA